MFLRLARDSEQMRGAAWDAALAQALLLFGGERSAKRSLEQLVALAQTLEVADVPAGAPVEADGEYGPQPS